MATDARNGGAAVARAAAVMLALVCGARGQEAALRSGYPRPMLFRENFPRLLPKYGHVQMMVSDLHTDKRKFCDEEFKRRHPGALMLVQFNHEPTGIWGTWEMLPRQKLEDLGWLDPGIRQTNPLLDIFNHDIYPMMDFPGHWVYEAGADILENLPAGEQTVTFRVNDITPFLPVAHRLSRNVAKQFPDIETALLKEVVIYARKPDGSPDWLGADMGSITAIDQKERSVTVRRWKTRKPWTAFEAGAYAAPSAVPATYANAGTARSFPPHLRERMREVAVMKPFLPNLAPNCPVDPRTGLTAVETMARHYIAMKPKHYPLADGFVFDVSCGTFTPSHRVSDRVDSDNDGRIDNFHFNGALNWPVGIYDFCVLLREGKPGFFEGLGEDLLLLSDSNFNEDQRFFEVFNGGEYEHSFTLFFPPYNFMYSSNLDRWLLWDRIGRKPNISFIHNKYADEAHHGGDVADLERPATLAHYRLDMATACMGSGFVGKMVLRSTHGGNPGEVDYPGLKDEKRTYGGMLPKIYDEYHAGRGAFGWLGQPKGGPVRLAPSGEALYAFSTASEPPRIGVAKEPWQVAAPVRTPRGFAFEILQTGVWHELADSFSATVVLPLPGVELRRNNEYTVSFRLKGSPVYDAFGPRYRNIPKNLRLRFSVANRPGRPAGTRGNRTIEQLDSNVAQLLGGGATGGGYMQEVLVFPGERTVVVTLPAGSDGPALLEFCASEEPGTYEIADLEIREGCADVLVREFDNGLVIANGSPFSDATLDIGALFPGSSFRRIKGTQDPVHNNGEPAGRVVLKQGDGLFLERIRTR